MSKSNSLLAKLAPQATLNFRKITIALYVVVAFLYWMSLYIYVPTLPTYVQSKVGSLATVGVVLSMYGLWQALLRLPLGIAADWWGRRKPFIIAGLALAGFGAWMMAIAGGAAGLTAGRAITGLAAAACVPLVVAFPSLFPSGEVIRATAMLTFANSLGRILATSVTGSLNQWGGYSLAFFLAAAAAAIGILFLLPVKEQPRPRVRPSVQNIGQLVTRKDVLLPALLAAVSQYANWTTTFGFNPIVARQLGGTDVTQSMLVSMHIGVVLLGNLSATLIVKRIGSQKLVYAGFGLLSLGVGLAAYAPTLAVLFAAQFCLGLAQGISYPVLMGLSIQSVADAERTTAMGLHQAVYAIGMFGGPWISGLVASATGIRPMYALTAVACLALGFLGASRLSPSQLKR